MKGLTLLSILICAVWTSVLHSATVDASVPSLPHKNISPDNYFDANEENVNFPFQTSGKFGLSFKKQILPFSSLRNALTRRNGVRGVIAIASVGILFYILNCASKLKRSKNRRLADGGNACGEDGEEENEGNPRRNEGSEEERSEGENESNPNKNPQRNPQRNAAGIRCSLDRTCYSLSAGIMGFATAAAIVLFVWAADSELFGGEIHPAIPGVLGVVALAGSAVSAYTLIDGARNRYRDLRNGVGFAPRISAASDRVGSAARGFGDRVRNVFVRDRLRNVFVRDRLRRDSDAEETAALEMGLRSGEPLTAAAESSPRDETADAPAAALGSESESGFPLREPLTAAARTFPSRMTPFGPDFFPNIETDKQEDKEEDENRDN